MRRTAKKRAGVLAVALVGLAGGAVASAVAQLDGPADPVNRPNPVITVVDADQAAAFGILRGASGAPAELSSSASALVSNGLGPDVGASAALARTAGATPDGVALYVVPGDGWLCLVRGDGGGGCNRTSEVLAGYGLMLQRQGSAVALEGLVPDGVSSIDITSASDHVTVTPTANVWTARVTFTPSTVAWTGQDGVRHEVPIAVPADALGP